MNAVIVWFRVAMWLGIVVDWVRSVPAIVAPDWTLTHLGQRGSTSPTWVAFSFFLVFLLSLFFITGANDPIQYSASGWLSVLVRLCRAIFFLALYPGLYVAFGLADLVLLLIQAPLLLLMLRSNQRPLVSHHDSG